MSLRDQMKECDIFDNAVLRHGFTDYNRDYEMTVNSIVGPMPSGLYSYLFRGCVEAACKSNVLVHSPSLDDVFIDYQAWEAAGTPDGFVWGVKWADAYPGWRYIEKSPSAANYSKKLSIEMHEVIIETNTYTIDLVFHDLLVTALPATASDGHWGKKNG